MSDDPQETGEGGDQSHRELEDRREVKRALQESEQLYRALIEQAVEGIWVADLETHEIIDVNRAFCDYLGYERDELIGMRIDVFIDRSEAEIERFKQILREKGAIPPTEGRWLTRDGDAVEVQITSNLIRQSDRDLVCTIGRDIREKKRLEAQLELSDRLASIGTLSAGIAHELNNPLAYLLTNLHFLEEETERWEETGEPPDLEEWKTVLQQSKRGVDRMRQVVDDLRSFYRSGHEDLRPVDIRSVVEGVLELATSDLPEAADVVREFDDIPPIEANEAALEQALLNVLVNAVQAVDEAESREENHRIEIRTRETEADGATVEIADTGIGIPDEDLGRIFDPFFTTKPVDVGTGLGLSITHSIIHSFGGGITVESEEGEGTRVSISFPPLGEADLPEAGPDRFPPSTRTDSGGGS